MISVHFQGKPLKITVIQVYVPTSNAEEAEGEGAVCELEIHDLTLEDAGEYSCMCGQEKTSAMLSVRGKDRVWPHGLAFGGCPLSLCSQFPFPPC